MGIFHFLLLFAYWLILHCVANMGVIIKFLSLYRLILCYVASVRIIILFHPNFISSGVYGRLAIHYAVGLLAMNDTAVK